MPKTYLKLGLEEDVIERLSRLSEVLGVDVVNVIDVMAEVAAVYHKELSHWARELRVKKENIPFSLFEEMFYYAITAWRELISKTLEAVRARGRYELEELDFDPASGTLEAEFVALEGSDLKADRLVILWSPSGVSLEAYYYLEEGEEPPKPGEKGSLAWDYLPDEHALVIHVSGSGLDSLPPVYKLDQLYDRVTGGSSP